MLIRKCQPKNTCQEGYECQPHDVLNLNLKILMSIFDLCMLNHNANRIKYAFAKSLHGQVLYTTYEFNNVILLSVVYTTKPQELEGGWLQDHGGSGS